MRTYLVAAALSLAATVAAWGFDFARYQEADLDDLLAQKRPEVGADIFPLLPYKITVDLVSYAAPCDTTFLKRAMLMGGVPRDRVDALPVGSCILVRSATRKNLILFIQDKVAEFLPKEIPIGSKVIFYVTHLYTASSGPGLLVNEFFSRATFAGKDNACRCGGEIGHTGPDYLGPEGSPITVVDDGIVVKVETDEDAMVDARNGIWCGRYVVVRHDYPNGRHAFTRVAELGRIVGGDGGPLREGAHVAKGDKIGEIGSGGLFHFEVRPVEPASVKTGVVWQRNYGADPAMEWSKYPPVDPKTFDADVFGGREAK